LGALEKLRERYAEQVAFFVVYIKEAHPEDGWALTYNRRSGIELLDPRSAEERAEVASSCAVRMRTSIPVLIDELDNEVARQYGGWPDRLYLVARDGRVAFQGAAGPFGFKPENLERAIEAELGSPGASETTR
jgi:Iodothyronine deiodinase